MAMPIDLLFVRHGQSESNVLVERRTNGQHMTDEYATVPDNSWRLTEKGARQAEAAGQYIRNNFLDGFDRYIVSPFVRTRETAARLDLPDAAWEENRMIRERSWGEIDGISIEKFEKSYPLNKQLKEKDPIYWVPPAGESLASVADNRSSNFLDGLNEKAGDRVIAVTHGEFIKTVRMILERWSDEKFRDYEDDESQTLHNCVMVHYSRRNPETQEIADSIQWMRRSYPHENASGDMEIVEGKWERVEPPKKLTNAELLELAEAQEHRLTEVESIKAGRLTITGGK